VGVLVRAAAQRHPHRHIFHTQKRVLLPLRRELLRHLALRVRVPRAHDHALVRPNTGDELHDQLLGCLRVDANLLVHLPHTIVRRVDVRGLGRIHRLLVTVKEPAEFINMHCAAAELEVSLGLCKCMSVHPNLRVCHERLNCRGPAAGRRGSVAAAPQALRVRAPPPTFFSSCSPRAGCFEQLSPELAFPPVGNTRV